MKIKISDNNKIENSNIGINNKFEREEKGKKILIDILVGLFVTIAGGIAVYFLTK